MNDEGRGLVHWVRVDLTARGIKLYVTPLDAEAVVEGWQYRLRWIRDVVNNEQLAVAINATLFGSNSDWRPRWVPRMAGDLARSADTVVAAHVIAPAKPEAYLLWFDDQLTPHLSLSKPTPAELAMAKWGTGSQAVWLHDGKVWPSSDRTPNARTAVAIDERQKLLFLAVGKSISPRRLLQILAKLGAKDGMLLDGGFSSVMAIGQGAKTVPTGIVLGGWRPVATYFGIKAEPFGAAGH